MEVADRIVVMSNGRIEQVGSPEDVYHHPVNPFVYNFLGNVNLFHARMVDGRPAITGNGLSLRADSQTRLHERAEALVYVRPHMMDIDAIPRGDISVKAKVKHVNAAGPLVKVELTAPENDDIHVELPQERYRALRLKQGDDVFVIPRDMRLFVNAG